MSTTFKTIITASLNDDEMDIAKRIVSYGDDHPGHTQNWPSLGGYHVAKPVIDKLIAAGDLCHGIRISPKGKRMKSLFTRGCVHLSE